jgi:leucyl aminopeptidase (aminopeptidase T)
MRRTLLYVSLLTVATPSWAADPDPRAIAERVVGQVAGVREGEVVLIGAPDTEFELASQLAWAVRRKKADSLSLIRREVDERRSYDEVPPQLDNLPEYANLKLVDIIDVEIYISHRENLALLEDVPAARRTAREQALTPVEEAFHKKSVRYVDIGNNLFPTDATAKRFGLSKAALTKLFWAAIDVDYPALAARGEAVKAALVGKVAHLTHPNGTDLEVGIADRPILVSDGVISEADRKIGGAAVQVWLPAGEVYLVPVPGTAKGTLVIDRSFVDGQEVLGLRLTFEAGKLVEMNADKGLELVEAAYDSAGEGRDRFGVIDVGINPALIAPKGSKLVSWVSWGTVTTGIGNDLWAGGTNGVAFGHYGHMQGTSLKVDGRDVIKDGALVVGGASGTMAAP